MKTNATLTTSAGSAFWTPELIARTRDEMERGWETLRKAPLPPARRPASLRLAPPFYASIEAAVAEGGITL